MKSDKLTIRITAKDGGEISPSSLVAIVRGITLILNEVDAQVSGTTKPTMLWRVEALSKNSPIGTTWYPETDHVIDFGKPVLMFSSEGIAKIGQSSDSLPPNFTRNAVRGAAMVAGTYRKDVMGVDFLSPYSDPVSFSNSIVANSRKLTSIRTNAYTSRGSFKGKIESISIRNSKVFHIEDVAYGYVECKFGDDLLPSLKSGLFSERVRVTGEVTYTHDHRPISIRVDNIVRLRSRSELPQVSDLEKIRFKEPEKRSKTTDVLTYG